jgi:DNA-binding NtrC family response regulator
MPTVLIVEDDDQIRLLAQSVFEDEGFATLDAGGLESARALIDSDQPIDILFTDLELGEDSEGGLLVAQHVRETRPEVKIVYTTGKAMTEGLRAAFVEGAVFVPKPYTPDQVLAAVRGTSGS